MTSLLGMMIVAVSTIFPLAPPRRAREMPWFAPGGRCSFRRVRGAARSRRARTIDAAAGGAEPAGGLFPAMTGGAMPYSLPDDVDQRPVTIDGVGTLGRRIATVFAA